MYDIIIKDISGSRLSICGDNDAKAIFKKCVAIHYRKKMNVLQVIIRKKSMIKHRK